MKHEEAFYYIVRWLKDPPDSGPTSYGCDLYLPNVWQQYVEAADESLSYDEAKEKGKEVSPFFLSAAWELFRRGVIRPGPRQAGAHSPPEGSAYYGFSITSFGQTWLKEADREHFVPTEPERFAMMFKPFEPRFGATFYERSQMAIHCYGAHAYLACCSMCGSAAESILLAVAIAKFGNQDKVMKYYSTADGPTKIRDMVIKGQLEGVQSEFRFCCSLLKYWREIQAHGEIANISDNEAYTSLALLLRFAQFANDRWETLTEAKQ
jgi:hypothetical protein